MKAQMTRYSLKKYLPAVPLVSILVIALGIRVVWAIISPEIDPFLKTDPLHGDGASYERIARSLIAGTGYSQYPPIQDIHWPPTYPFMLAGIHLLFGPDLLPARIVQAFLGTFCVFLMYQLGKMLIGRRLALVAAAGLALYPYHIYWGNWIIAESLFIVILLLILLLLVSIAQRLSYLQLALLGGLIGLEILTKPAFLFTVPFIFLFLAIRYWSKSIKQVLIILALTGVCAAAVILPWTARNYIQYNEFVLVSLNGGLTFYGANNPAAFGGHVPGFPHAIPGLTPPQEDREFFRRGIDWIVHNPTEWAKLIPLKFYRLWSPLSVATDPEPMQVPFTPFIFFIYWSFLGISLLGLVISHRRCRDCGILLIPAYGTLLVTQVFYGDTRYALPMIPALIIYATLGGDHLISLFQTWLNRLRQKQNMASEQL